MNQYFGIVPLITILSAPATAQESCGAAAPHFEKSLGIDLAYGCLVEDIQQGSLSSQQGLAPRDLIVSLNGKPFRDFPSTKEFLLDARGAAASTKADLKVVKFEEDSYAKSPTVVHFTMSPAQLSERIALGFKCKGQAVVLSIGPRSPLEGTDIRPGDFILQINDREIAGDEVAAHLEDPKSSGKILPQVENPLMIDQVVKEALESPSNVVSLIFGRWLEDKSVSGARQLEARLVVIDKSDLPANRK